MTYTLKNDCLTATVSSLGAELISVRRDACEYIWQGDPAYWDGKNPLLFPICGRLNNGKYTFGGKTYEMGLHGFARKSEFTCLSHSDTELSLKLTPNATTRAAYPFEFAFTVTYRLCGDRIELSARIENNGDVAMPATFGGHPGFRTPPEGDSDFSDWFLEFGEECDPDQIEIAPSGLQTGLRNAYPLQDHRILPLSHDLFQIDGVFLVHMSDTVTLKSHRCPRAVTLTYPDMTYLGIWQTAQSDAPFVCIEPWCGMADYDNVPLDFSKKTDMFLISPNTAKTVGFTMQFI